MLNKTLQQVGERIDRMSLRERVFILVAAVIVVFALVQLLLIDAGLARKNAASARVQEATAALQRIADEQQLLARQGARDPDALARESLAAQEARLAALSRDLEGRERSLIPPARMHQVLKDVVKDRAGIRIVGFKTLSPEPVSVAGAPEGTPPGFYRHGFEIVVNGSYADLVDYLQRLEALPWRLNWIEAKLDATDRPVLSLTLTVHTLSLEDAWLRV
jgi:MSHA biogenesis protein MshJ